MDRTVNLEFLRSFARQILLPSRWLGEPAAAVPASGISHLTGLEQCATASFKQDPEPAAPVFVAASPVEAIPAPAPHSPVAAKIVRTLPDATAPVRGAAEVPPSSRLGSQRRPPARPPAPAPQSASALSHTLSRLQQRANERRLGVFSSRIIKRPDLDEPT